MLETSKTSWVTPRSPQLPPSPSPHLLKVQAWWWGPRREPSFPLSVSICLRPPPDPTGASLIISLLRTISDLLFPGPQRRTGRQERAQQYPFPCWRHRERSASSCQPVCMMLHPQYLVLRRLPKHQPRQHKTSIRNNK